MSQKNEILNFFKISMKGVLSLVTIQKYLPPPGGGGVGSRVNIFIFY